MTKNEYCCITKEGEEYLIDAYTAEQAIQECESMYSEEVTECYLNEDYPMDDLT